MRRASAITFFAFFLALVLWGYFLFYFPTLDFDEALYRRIAEGMKASNNPWSLTWDGRDLFHKPPFFYWLIVMFSNVIDGGVASVSTVAARLPSFFSTLGTLIYLYFSAERFQGGQPKEKGSLAVLAFLCALFPLLTATSVIFDPLQTFALMPALVVPSLLFFDEKKLKPGDWSAWTLSLFAASAVKGLNGVIVPSFAFALQLLIGFRHYGFSRVFVWARKFIFWVLLPSLALIFLYFAWLNEKLGAAFTHEFIWVQHFERGTSPMEEHSGSFFYQFIVVFFGGGVLSSLVLNHVDQLKSRYSKVGFPLTYTLSFCVVFGLSATKLPHYSWPVWPALALFVGIFSSGDNEVHSAKSSVSHKIAMGFAKLPLLLIALLCFTLAFESERFFGIFSANRSFSGVVHYFSGFQGYEITFLMLAALLCAGIEFGKKRILTQVPICASISVLIALSMTFALSRTVKELLVTPFYEIADSVKRDGAVSSDCIRYSGALSPTLSLALAPELLHNRCEPEAMKYLISPEWKAKECEERHFKVIDQKAYLVLCKKG